MLICRPFRRFLPNSGTRYRLPPSRVWPHGLSGGVLPGSLAGQGPSLAVAKAKRPAWHSLNDRLTLGVAPGGDEDRRRTEVMDTSRFTKADDGFDLLDLKARFAFKTETSISFNIGRWSNTLRLPAGEGKEEFVWSADRPLVFTVIGWIDAHHPCDSLIKAQLRICIPTEYHQVERMKSIVKALCEALSISPEEHCESKFFASGKATGFIPPVYLGMG
jgi:hypothetical protein